MRRSSTKALMKLDDRLLNRSLSERLAFDDERNTLFLGLDGYRVHNRSDVDAIREGVFCDLCTSWSSVFCDHQLWLVGHCARYGRRVVFHGR